MQKFAIGTAIAGLLAADRFGRYCRRGPHGWRIGSQTMRCRTWIYGADHGTVSGPLSQCIATGVHGLSSNDPTVFTTAYVDITCPSSDD
jgi:hypothetical protein